MTELKSEADVKREVKKLLNKYDWFYWMPAGSAYGNNNVDFNCLKNGFFLAIETKFGKNKATINQERFITNINKYGGLAIIVRENTLDMFEQFLKNCVPID